MSIAAFCLGLAQIPFIINLAMSIFAGEKVNRNPWNSTTVEWAAPSPPLGHGNFDKPVNVYHSAYEYSVPDSKNDFTPQFKE